MTTWLGGLDRRAEQVLPAPLYRYIVQGARDGVTASEAAGSWAAHRLSPHVLRDVTDVETATSLLGAPVAVPMGIAPTTLQGAVHEDGEVAMASAAASAGSLLVLSSNAGRSFAEVADTGVAWWLQLYLPADRTLALPLLARAVEAGARAVVLTVDTPVVGTKYDGPGPTVWDLVDPGLLRVNFDPGYGEAPGSEKATDLGPHDIAWVLSKTGLPVIVKGVLRADDARRCVQAGASAVWVSNHGGRQLDRVLTTAAALREVAEEVGSSTEVYVDGGVRSGLDVLTALALGARAVFLGRVPLFALALGPPALARMHEELRTELVEAMRLAGCRRLSDCGDLVG